MHVVVALPPQIKAWRGPPRAGLSLRAFQREKDSAVDFIVISQQFRPSDGFVLAVIRTNRNKYCMCRHWTRSS